MKKLNRILISVVLTVLLSGIVSSAALASDEQYGYIMPENAVDFVPKSETQESSAFPMLQASFGSYGYYSGIQFADSTSPYCTGADTKYNTDHGNYITSVKNQGGLGTCWIFGPFGALESAIWKQLGETVDISEMYALYAISNASYIDNPFNAYIDKDTSFAGENGGNEQLISAYWSRGTLSSLVPDDICQYSSVYDPVSGKYIKTIASRKLSDIQELSEHGMDYYPAQSVLLNLNNLYSGDNYSAMTGAAYIRETKDLIKAFGSASGAIYYDSSGTKEENGDLVFNYSKFVDTPLEDYYTCNHEVLFVGWDDTYDCGTEHPGAFLIRNSWGENRYGGGYFWMSYDSYFTDVMAVAEVVHASDLYDRIYETDSTTFDFQYSDEPQYSVQFNAGEYALMKRTYTASGENELLTGVMVFCTEPGTEYKIYFTDSETVTADTEWTALETESYGALTFDSETGYVKASDAGYLTIRFADAPTVSGNFTFYVVAHNDAGFWVGGTDNEDPMYGSAVSSSLCGSSAEITPDNFASATRKDGILPANFTLKVFTKQQCDTVSYAEMPLLYEKGSEFTENTAVFDIGTWTESIPVYSSMKEGSAQRFISETVSGGKLSLSVDPFFREDVSQYSQRCYLGFRDTNGNEIRVPVTIGKSGTVQTGSVLKGGILYLNNSASDEQFIASQYDGTNGQMLSGALVVSSEHSLAFDLRSLTSKKALFKLFSLDGNWAPVESTYNIDFGK